MLTMILDRIFHIYNKTTGEPLQWCLTTDEMESLLKDKKIDWKTCEVQPCSMDLEFVDASY